MKTQLDGKLRVTLLAGGENADRIPNELQAEQATPIEIAESDNEVELLQQKKPGLKGSIHRRIQRLSGEHTQVIRTQGNAEFVVENQEDEPTHVHHHHHHHYFHNRDGDPKLTHSAGAGSSKDTQLPNPVYGSVGKTMKAHGRRSSKAADSAEVTLHISPSAKAEVVARANRFSKTPVREVRLKSRSRSRSPLKRKGGRSPVSPQRRGPSKKRRRGLPSRPSMHRRQCAADDADQQPQPRPPKMFKRDEKERNDEGAEVEEKEKAEVEEKAELKPNLKAQKKLKVQKEQKKLKKRKKHRSSLSQRSPGDDSDERTNHPLVNRLLDAATETEKAEVQKEQKKLKKRKKRRSSLSQRSPGDERTNHPLVNRLLDAATETEKAEVAAEPEDPIARLMTAAKTPKRTRSVYHELDSSDSDKWL